MDDATEPRLTSLAHGGGCGCKIAPGVLADMLKAVPQAAPFANLMVGNETSDDAAVWRLNDQQALVATTDFFMPVVDDPFDFGRIAATNALSDVYAMGGTPILALALVGMPISVLSPATIGRILAGGAAVCADAGIPVAGGHSIDSVEPIYGLVALGLAHPDRVLTNRGARPGDVLVLTKPLGVGVLSAAFKQGRLDAAGYDALIATTTRLNTLGAKLAGLAGVHAVTDVTGFGLLGHALEMARGAGVSITLDAAPPTLPGVEALLAAGLRTGASGRNWAAYGHDVEGLDEGARRDLLTDPQTSGGLLISVGEDQAEALLALARADGFDRAAIVGRIDGGPAGVRVA
ncbi:MAG: selenide, water dikinase SelD [Alphaproteobacteria bacterium]|nr:selenide, water dikinase SelD [Alphaproteobacteria bacterium]MBU1527292.1 selenide, water dikinase SelD [Alphaproteobacteria bacterium]MBU2116335.1 selenide, water dikinase SelD [Alphaproteobacteria bacterium]MBU2349965.1 selenide, water dikinase SelD [Alphaproteobacteria bacterium]MBU2382214.1 selenide, water dikinase SelD [Alphaproteobacteria bacterium]